MRSKKSIRKSRQSVQQRLLRLLACAVAVILLLPATARADMGPKPSVVVQFKGLQGQRYYATLLTSVESTGPFSVSQSGEPDRYTPGDAEYDIARKFTQYQDPDGFYFLQEFGDCTQAQQFSWTYYPPDTFKVLLYFPDTDSFTVSSESYERYAFDSYFTADLTGFTPAAGTQAGFKLTHSYNYGLEISMLALRILLTIAIELGVALLFGFKHKRLFRFIVIVNVITQAALNITLNIIEYHMGGLAFILFFVLLELLIFLIEAILYAVGMQKRSEQKIPGWKPWVYAFAANAASFVLGLVLAFALPGMF